MKHAFQGVKVLELGGYIVAALCTSLLADLGAEVIKVESPQGDGLRGLLGGFQGWNRGKRGIALNLGTDDARTILHQLVKQADVLVQNLRPGVAERWGADYETLSRINSRLVYCAMPAYGQTGPYIEKPGFDPLLQARSGAMAAQGGSGQPPVYYIVAICDYAGAMLGAYGVAMALYHRARTGKGQRVNGSLLNASIAVQAGEFVAYPGKPDDPPKDSLGVGATWRIYRTKDGWILIECEDDSSWALLCKVLGKEELTRDPRFQTAVTRQENAAELTGILEAVFARESREHWLALLETAGVPCAPVNYCRDLFTHPQLLENDLVAEHDSKDLVRVKQMGMAVKLSETPGKLWCGSPALGQHTEEVLSELGYSSEGIQKLKAKRVIP